MVAWSSPPRTHTISGQGPTWQLARSPRGTAPCSRWQRGWGSRVLIQRWGGEGLVRDEEPTSCLASGATVERSGTRGHLPSWRAPEGAAKQH